MGGVTHRIRPVPRTVFLWLFAGRQRLEFLPPVRVLAVPRCVLVREQVGQRVRWNILEQMPYVADVLVNIAVDPKPCPVLSSLRPQDEIEQARGSVEGD